MSPDLDHSGYRTGRLLRGGAAAVGTPGAGAVRGPAARQLRTDKARAPAGQLPKAAALWAGIVALCFLAGLGGWAATTPRAGVAMAPAVTVANGTIPGGDELLLDVRVAPRDVAEVRVGLVAQVRLRSNESRNVPPLEGTVREVSADRKEDPTNHQTYYLARVAIVPAVLPAGVVLSAGTPADVDILTSGRPLLDRLLRSLTDTLRRGLRES